MWKLRKLITYDTYVTFPAFYYCIGTFTPMYYLADCSWCATAIWKWCRAVASGTFTSLDLYKVPRLVNIHSCRHTKTWHICMKLNMLIHASGSACQASSPRMWYFYPITDLHDRNPECVITSPGCFPSHWCMTGTVDMPFSIVFPHVSSSKFMQIFNNKKMSHWQMHKLDFYLCSYNM